MISPSFILAFVFFIVSSILFLLWGCRNAIMARLAPIQLQLEIPAGTSDLEAALAPSLPAHPVGAPAYLIRKLPVFAYAPASRSDERDTKKADQDNSINAGDSAGTCGASRVHSQLSTPLPAALVTPKEATADVQVSDTAPLADQQTSISHQSSNSELLQQHQQLEQQQELRDQACSSPQQPQQYASWVQQLVQQQHLRTINELSVNRDQQADVPYHNREQQQHQQQQQLQLHISDQTTGQKHMQPCDDGHKQDGEDTCIICLSDYVPGELLKQLPCKHIYHAQCVDKWLRRNSTCPLCKVSIMQPATGIAAASGEATSDSMVSAVVNAARVTNAAAATELHIPHSARLAAHILAELQQQRRVSMSSSRPSALSSNGISRWDNILLSSRGSLAAAGAVAAAGGAVARS